MSPLHFALLPFAPLPSLAGLALTGMLERRGNRLQIHYHLAGPLERVRLPGTPPLPPPAARPSAPKTPARRDGLWESTCLELFLARPGEPLYREFNLSPSGEWNVYRLTGYRQGLEPEPLYGSLPFRVEVQENGLRLALALDLAPIAAPQEPLEVAVCAVVELAEGEISHWALAHPGPEADFHRRDAFLLRI